MFVNKIQCFMFSFVIFFPIMQLTFTFLTNYFQTRGHAQEVVRVGSLGLPCNQDHLLPIRQSSVLPHCWHPPWFPTVPYLLSINWSLGARGRDQEVVHVPHRDWSIGHSGYYTVMVTSLLLYKDTCSQSEAAAIPLYWVNLCINVLTSLEDIFSVC